MKDIYWFHGFLVVLQENIKSDAIVTRALTRGKSFLGDSYGDRTIHLIVISLRQVAFAQLSGDVLLTSKRLGLLSNHSATKCSPGFRALTRILTSDCWKKPPIYQEQWRRALPPELLYKILGESKPRDGIAFAQASFAIQQCYYVSVPQLDKLIVQSYRSSIPCCGKRSYLEQHGVCCSNCHSWQHLECVGLTEWPPNNQYICVTCKKTTQDMKLDPGGINRKSRRTPRIGCRVKAGNSEKRLKL